MPRVTIGAVNPGLFLRRVNQKAKHRAILYVFLHFSRMGFRLSEGERTSITKSGQILVNLFNSFLEIEEMLFSKIHAASGLRTALLGRVKAVLEPKTLPPILQSP